jgi:hypothetical protein
MYCILLLVEDLIRSTIHDPFAEKIPVIKSRLYHGDEKENEYYSRYVLCRDVPLIRFLLLV